MLSSGHKAARKHQSNRMSNQPRNVKLKPKAYAARLFEIEVGVFKRLARAVNSPFAHEQLKRVEEGNWLGIATAPMPDTASESFPDDYLLQQVFRKNPKMPINVDRKAAAIDKWKVAEAACRNTNDLIRLCQTDFAQQQRASLAIHPEVLSGIRRTIKKVLGPLDTRALQVIEAKTRFGPGATFHCAGKDLTPNKKLQSKIGLTPSLVKFVGSLEPYAWLTTTSGYALTRGSRACTVSKDALTDRFIAIEPALNMRWQLGIGGFIRQRLKSVFSLDLDNQADVNRALVRVAEALGLATIDLESASDSVALLLVRYLFPHDWVRLLEAFRSPEMLVDGQWLQLEKISSMGNGFTFELETLLFFAVAKQFEEKPAVFGDDIIVPQACAADVIRTLNVLGFSVNRKKTFLAGSFFESCGVDVWRGQDVRPFYLKKGEDETDLTSSIIRMVNSIRRYASSRYSDHGCDSRFLPAWLYAHARSEDASRTFIPNGMGDDGVVRNRDECNPVKLPYGWQGFKGRIWARRPVTQDVTGTMAGVFSAIDRESNQLASTRGSGEILLRWNRSHTLLSLNHEPVYLAYRYRKGSRPLDMTDLGMSPQSIPLEYHGLTAGLIASSTVQSVRGRLGKGSLRDLPCFAWEDIGPWL